MRIAGLIILLCLFTNSLQAIVPPLEREISLDLHGDKITAAFTKIQEQAQVVFSYQPALIQSLGPITIRISKKTVREALLILLPATITFKQKNNYIILKNKPPEKNPEKGRISGYVYDANTDKRVANVTIYDKESLHSATTDEYGYYTLKVPEGSDSVRVNKQDYAGTVVSVDSLKESGLTNFRLQPDTLEKTRKDSSALQMKLSDVNAFAKKIFSDFKAFVHTDNIRDTLNRDFQVSLVPFVGTNHRLSGLVNNHLSINIIGGYARGLKGVEWGTLFNFEKENAKGFQAAGLFNFVGDSAVGTQLAGVMNICGRASTGFQAAALMNIVPGQQKGIQLAGLMNVDHRSQGLSAAGLLNLSGHAKGAQLSVIGNVDDTLQGVSVAALFNSARYGINAVQSSVLFNRCRNGSSAFQLGVFFNRTEHLKGTQFAMLNYADTASGVPVGLLSIVGTGLHQLEFSTDELFAANLSFRTGVPAFYNIISIGTQNAKVNAYWQMGYGIGTSVRIGKRFSIDLTGSVHHISRGTLYLSASEQYRLYLGLEFKATKRFTIAGGPTLNYYVTDMLTPQYESDYRYFTPAPYKETSDAYDFNRKSWAGFKVALRFF